MSFGVLHYIDSHYIYTELKVCIDLSFFHYSSFIKENICTSEKRAEKNMPKQVMNSEQQYLIMKQ